MRGSLATAEIHAGLCRLESQHIDLLVDRAFDADPSLVAESDPCDRRVLELLGPRLQSRGAHVHAFSFFGAVALSIVYDNDRCLVSRIERDGTRRRTRLFSGFLSHYLIGDRYGRPGKGNDKGTVEGLVGWSRRNFMVPLPRFASLEALNGYLKQRCRERQSDVLRGHRESIAKRLERDLEAMTALPGAPFDACHQAAGQVSSQSLVRYHNNDYSVPVAYGYRQVWVRGYVDRVVIGCGAEVTHTPPPPERTRSASRQG